VSSRAPNITGLENFPPCLLLPLAFSTSPVPSVISRSQKSVGCVINRPLFRFMFVRRCDKLLTPFADFATRDRVCDNRGLASRLVRLHSPTVSCCPRRRDPAHVGHFPRHLYSGYFHRDAESFCCGTAYSNSDSGPKIRLRLRLRLL